MKVTLTFLTLKQQNKKHLLSTRQGQGPVQGSKRVNDACNQRKKQSDKVEWGVIRKVPVVRGVSV